MEMYNEKEYSIEHWNVPGIELEVPTIIANSRKENKIGYLFIGGLNATLSAVRLFKAKEFNGSTIISFDGRAQGDNKNKGSKNKWKYVDDIKLFIDKLINDERFKNIKHWIILGESWGSALAILYWKKYGSENKISKIICWNCPYCLVDISNKTKKEKFSDGMRMLKTFLFNIETTTENKVNELLVNNNFVIRMFRMKSNPISYSTPVLAAWRTFKPAWKYFNKNFNDMNISYMQSSNDCLAKMKFINKSMKTNNKIYKIEGGSHILIFDMDKRQELLDWIFNNTKNV